MSGYALVGIPGLGVHCVPVDDLRDHMDEDCPCKPIQCEETGLWSHNSFDGREAFEDGDRKPS